MYKLEDLKKPDNCQAFINGKWVSARPINYKYRTFFTKIKEAYQVFTGKADAFKWPEGQ